MTDQKLTKDALRQFTGTEKRYRHHELTKAVYTDGVRYVVKTTGAYWLINAIVFEQDNPEVAAQPFQVWTMTVNLSQSKGVLTCEDRNGNIIFTSNSDYTDFPLDEIRLYFCDNVLLLTSEY